MRQSKLVEKNDFYEAIGRDNLANIVTLDRREDQDIVLWFLMDDEQGCSSKKVRLNTNLAEELRKMLNEELE